jgi:hypothetical protein
MKKIIILAVLAGLTTTGLFAQYKREKEERDEKEPTSFKENLFTGGSVSLAFYNNTFLIGASPVFGYSLANWADIGIVVNYNYTSYRDYNFVFNDKLRQKVYGGGGFVKLYPIRFLFAQAQVEHNFIRQKFIPQAGAVERAKGEAGSFLVGGGYTTGRYGRGGDPFFYVAVLFDLSNNINSPYTDGYGRSIPIIRGGIQIPLFQGGGRDRDK